MNTENIINKKEYNMIEEKSWKEFQESGLLWMVNMNLHLFGWAIAVETEGDIITRAYPVRTKFRGFSENANDLGYKRVTEYLENNIKELKNEL